MEFIPYFVYDVGDYVKAHKIGASIQAGAALILTGAIVGWGVHQNDIANINRAHADHDIKAQLGQDGFSPDNEDEVETIPHYTDGRVDFRKLVLGACEFRYVTAQATMRGNRVKDISKYRAPAGQDGVTVRFENADQLQATLPSLKCSP